MSPLLLLLINFVWALLPVVVAGFSILALKRSVPALFLALLPLACIVCLAHPENGLLLESILATYQQMLSPSVFTVLLLGAGVALINNGPAHGFARRLVARIHNPMLRLCAGLGVGTITGFGSSSMAAQFLADLFAEPEAGPPALQTNQNLALAVGACTFGSLLIPFSVWWIYFMGATKSTPGHAGPPLQIAASGWFYAMPLIFCLSLTLLLLSSQWKRNVLRRQNHDARFLLRLPLAPPNLREGVTWILYFSLLVAYPLLTAALFGKNDWQLPAGILLATLVAGGWWLLQDIQGPTQTLWPLPETGEPTTEGAAKAFQEMRSVVPTVLPARERRMDAKMQILPDQEAARATHLAFPRTRHRMPLVLARFQLALARQWTLWDRGIADGLGTVLVFVTAIVFRVFYTNYLKALHIHLDFSVLGTALHLSHPWLWHMAGCLLLIGLLGVIGGYFIGTAFGTFALVFSLLQPTLNHMHDAGPLARGYAQILVGLLIAIAAAINSCSPQADNVNVVSKQLQLAPEAISASVRGYLLQALAITLLCGLLLPLILH